MKSKYLIRLDDACPTMDSNKWGRIETLLDTYSVRPMVGVIPENNDSKQKITVPDDEFWSKVKKWEQKGWSIALHGYDHCYISNEGLNGLNPIWARSEFAGVSLEHQKDKIRKGVAKLNANGINPKYFFAPSHTYDMNTLVALREDSNIRIISDTIAIKPYRKDNFTFIPLIGGKCKQIPIPGVWVFCLHPSTMTEDSFISIEHFLQKCKKEIISFDELDISNLGPKDFFSHILSWGYFTLRKLKGIR